MGRRTAAELEDQVRGVCTLFSHSAAELRRPRRNEYWMSTTSAAMTRYNL